MRARLCLVLTAAVLLGGGSAAAAPRTARLGATVQLGHGIRFAFQTLTVETIAPPPGAKPAGPTHAINARFALSGAGAPVDWRFTARPGYRAQIRARAWRFRREYRGSCVRIVDASFESARHPWVRVEARRGPCAPPPETSRFATDLREHLCRRDLLLHLAGYLGQIALEGLADHPLPDPPPGVDRGAFLAKHHAAEERRRARRRAELWAQGFRPHHGRLVPPYRAWVVENGRPKTASGWVSLADFEKLKRTCEAFKKHALLSEYRDHGTFQRQVGLILQGIDRYELQDVSAR